MGALDPLDITRSFDVGRVADVPGLPPSALALFACRLASGAGVTPPLWIITVTDAEARQLTTDVTFFLAHAAAHDDGHHLVERAVALIPACASAPYDDASHDGVSATDRLAALARLCDSEDQPQVVICSGRALRQRSLDVATVRSLALRLKPESEVDRDTLVRHLERCGYQRVPIVDERGTFSLRGGLVDVFPPLHRYPARIDFFGDFVESVRAFDPESQRTLRVIPEVLLHPVQETVPTLDPPRLRERLLALADQAHLPSSQTRELLERVERGEWFLGIDALIPAFHERLAGLDEWIAPDAALMLVGGEAIAMDLAARDRVDATNFESQREGSRLCFPPAAYYASAKTVEAALAVRRRVVVGHVGASDAALSQTTARYQVKGNSDLAIAFQQARRDRGVNIADELLERVSSFRDAGLPVLLAAGSRARLQQLRAVFEEHGVAYVEPDEPALRWLYRMGPSVAPASPSTVVAPVALYGGQLTEGFRVAGELMVLSDVEVFGPRVRRRKDAGKRALGAALGDLRPGDILVHEEHGVGRYQGLTQLVIQGVAAEFVQIEYAGGDRLYVPVYRLNQVQQYAGGSGSEVALDRLGGLTWQRKRRRVKDDVRQLAEELLQLYARRAAAVGQAFPEPDAVYREFEATFPFDETEDQQKAIDDIIADLASATPADRLICGDVGFGKTEVAIRAAFHVAMSGKQVAVLAPTTVLVDQHFRTFASRMAPYPIRVEAASRFRKGADLAEVIRGLAHGQVDIVVGTHRLLQSDVQFKDLGLIVVDEEHRFGVVHKERLKRIRANVHVMTMTATPIPRTLQMGMAGMRPISVIATPPQDRLAVRTFTYRREDRVIAEGIRRELARDGQVFFVHNRVQGIDGVARELAQLVPEARIAVGHGQMDARRLERVMLDFVRGETNVLLCTTIIESGLDIPRANTMFIDHADRFGLAQLYQLRGRIGRSRERAYCYLMVAPETALSREAQERIAALQRFTELGSGFSIAMRDMEIRGAGELLGPRQSGHISQVGFETYARILEEAVAEARGETLPEQLEPELNTTVVALIPDTYVEDTGQRLTLYQRLSNAACAPDRISDIIDEMRDRYGPEPREVQALSLLMELKGLAMALGATVLDLTSNRLSLTVGPSTPLTPELVVDLMRTSPGRFKLTPKMQLVCKLSEDEQRDLLASVRKILRELCASVNRA